VYIPSFADGAKDGAPGKKQIPFGNDKQKGKGEYGDSGCARMTIEKDTSRFLRYAAE
jgi:hypothetical protein